MNFNCPGLASSAATSIAACQLGDAFFGKVSTKKSKNCITDEPTRVVAAQIR